MIKKIYNFFSRKRKVVVISPKGISSKEIGFLFCFWNLLLVLWMFFTTVKYFEYRQVLVQKDLKIADLTYKNLSLKKDINSFKLVKNYVKALNQYDRFNTTEVGNTEFVLNIDDTELNNKYSKKFAYILDREENNVKELNNLLTKRIAGMENLIAKTGLNAKSIKQASFTSRNNTNNLIEEQQKDHFDKALLRAQNADLSVKDNIDYLTYLETVVNKLPLNTPMNNYYITSNFGGRKDPFSRISTVHQGLDMAGPINAQISAPSSGKVIFTGPFGGYGQTIKIDHGNGVVTKYGHLKRILVNNGDVIKRGQAIGIQGNTGKSTGAHLHYEIQYNNRPLDPQRFIKTGNEIF
jgi:murein DD-endopeptidase MepM/ murein hydrolase activator NlpD